MLFKKITTFIAACATSFFMACDDSSSASANEDPSSSSTEIQSSQGGGSGSDHVMKAESFTYVIYIDEETLKCESETLIFDVSFDFGPSSDLKMIVDDKDIYKGKYRYDKDEEGEDYYLIQIEELGELEYYSNEALILTDPFRLYVKTQDDVQKGLNLCKQAVAEALYEDL